MRSVETRFRAMGTDVHAIVTGGSPADLRSVRDRVASLERLWSRFIPESEISVINARAGEPVRVSSETVELVSLAIEGWEATGGLFDPSVLPTMLAIGYDRSFEHLADLPFVPTPAPPGCGGIRIDRARSTVALAAGSGFDPGGIGKGLAADRIIAELIVRPGVTGACVNLGGDLRVAGESPDGRPWTVEVEDPFGGYPLGVLAVEEGAVATTSRMKRRWSSGGVERHHVIDPRSGSPAAVDLASVTVVAGEAWWAEVLSKAAFLAGREHAAGLLRSAGAEGVAVAADGSVLHLTGRGVLA